MLLMAVLAGAEGVLGLLQVGPSGGGMLYFGNEEPGQYVAIGTFVNRNHLAALLAMSLPVIVGLLVYSMRPGGAIPARTAMRRRRKSWRKRALLFATAVIILVCLLFTRSRAGIATGLVGLACSGVVLVRARAARAASVARADRELHRDRSHRGFDRHRARDRRRAAAARARRRGSCRRAPTFAGPSTRRRCAGAIEFLPFGSGLSTYRRRLPALPDRGRRRVHRLCAQRLSAGLHGAGARGAGHRRAAVRGLGSRG